MKPQIWQSRLNSKLVDSFQDLIIRTWIKKSSSWDAKKIDVAIWALGDVWRNLLLTKIGLCYYRYIFFHLISQKDVNSVSQWQIFIIRAIMGLVFAVIVTRMFYGRINTIYVVGLAVILVGLAYFAEFLRQRKSRWFSLQRRKGRGDVSHRRDAEYAKYLFFVFQRKTI